MHYASAHWGSSHWASQHWRAASGAPVGDVTGSHPVRRKRPRRRGRAPTYTLEDLSDEATAREIVADAVAQISPGKEPTRAGITEILMPRLAGVAATAGKIAAIDAIITEQLERAIANALEKRQRDQEAAIVLLLLS